MLVSWSWEWASCTIFSRAVVDLNERTCTYKPGLTGPEMALEWKSVFN